jgi:aminodeoxyfutalosine deaminase
LVRQFPFAGRCYREVTGFHLRHREARALVLEVRAPQVDGMLSGLSPHAPYSVSAELMRAAARGSRHLAIHCAELPEEQEFLRTGKGAFSELLMRLGRLPSDFEAPGCGAVRWLEKLGVLRKATQLVHCQELERGDVARIAKSGASIAVCPGTMDYFQRTPPPVDKWLKAGITVALGTDSRASNAGLSMRQELARAAEVWPGLRPDQLFEMATESGGKSLGCPVGSLRRGRRADLVIVPARSSWQDTLADFVHGILPIKKVVLAGVMRRNV